MNGKNKKVGLAKATSHGLVRTMERTGKDVSHSISLIQKAWNRGKATNEFNLLWNDLPKTHWITSDFDRESKTEHRVYKGNLFIFSHGGKLITMFPIPDDYYHKSLFRGKDRIRKAKQYYRMNSLVS